MIKDKIKEYLKASEEPIDINPVFAPAQQDVVDLIDKYWMSRYQETDYDNKGQKKVFYNIVTNPVWVAAKMIDLDVKNVRAIPLPGQNPLYALYLERDLNLYMKDNGFGAKLNEWAYKYPKYGTLVVKKANGIHTVPLQNLKLDPTAKSLKGSSFVIEEHEYTENQLRNMPWDKTAIEYAIAKNEDAKIKVYEIFGDLRGNNNYFITTIDTILHEDKRDIKDIYKELHWDKVVGRWLSRGQVELCFEDQIHMNWLAYLKAHGLEYTSKHIWKTDDMGIDRNMLVDVDDGEVLKMAGDIVPVPMEERNLAAYASEESRWEFNLQRKTFATDIIRGVRPPAGTPLGSAVLATQMAGGFFSYKQEEFGMFIKEIIWDWIIPDFKKKHRGEHLVDFVGADERQVKMFDELILEERTAGKIGEYLSTNKSFPTAEQISAMKLAEQSNLNNPQKRYEKVPEGIYDKLKYKIDIVISGENNDIQQKAVAIQTAIQNTQDPAQKRELINRLMVILGEEPLFARGTQGIEEIADKVGSQPRLPALRPTPTPGVQTSVV